MFPSACEEEPGGGEEGAVDGPEGRAGHEHRDDPRRPPVQHPGKRHGHGLWGHRQK